MTRCLLRGSWAGMWGVLVLGGCGEPTDSSVPYVPGAPDSGVGVTVQAQQALLDLDADAQAALSLTADEVRAAYPTSFSEELGYDPADAAYLDEILEGVGYGTPDESRQAILERGFSISERSYFPSFAGGYSEIYMADLPVYITADMILEAVYRSHDKILQQLESTRLRPLLGNILDSLHTRLVDQADGLSPETASDLNVYLSVARGLLRGGKTQSADPEVVSQLVDLAQEGEGSAKVVLFGVAREIDFSQFTPRGHYAGDADLESYFRAMIWLGRIDFRLIETKSDGSQVLRRNQVAAMLALHALFDDELHQHYRAFDEAITAFVGEHDYMHLAQVVPFLEDLETTDLDQVDDQTVAETLVAGRYGEQRIASHIMRKGSGGGTFPLNVSFALLGQRYSVDSHIFSQVVYDRLPTRVVPDPLDVAFAGLGNDQALALLGDELDEEAGLPGALASMRLLVDEHPDSYWDSSFYSSWFGALRALSPAANAEGLPAVARTEAWGRRLLSTQLASWAQLRHNNVLYVKQSYTSNAACEYPDAYVEPYPDFFERIVQLAERGQRLVGELKLEGDQATAISSYFERMRDINATLGQMASLQRSGEPHSEEHLAFINRAVSTSINCDGTVLGHSGWYADLHFDPLQAVKFDPSITDVHTDIGGDLPVQRPPSVLHVGTGRPRLMIVTVESCSGPRAYAGVVSAYHEHLEEGLVRLTDEEWEQQVDHSAKDVPWMLPILSGE